MVKETLFLAQCFRAKTNGSGRVHKTKDLDLAETRTNPYPSREEGVRTSFYPAPMDTIGNRLPPSDARASTPALSRFREPAARAHDNKYSTQLLEATSMTPTSARRIPVATTTAPSTPMGTAVRYKIATPLSAGRAKRLKPDGAWEEDDGANATPVRYPRRCLVSDEVENVENQQLPHVQSTATTPKRSECGPIAVARKAAPLLFDTIEETFTDIDPEVIDIQFKNDKTVDRLTKEKRKRPPLAQTARRVTQQEQQRQLQAMQDPRALTPRATFLNPKPEPLASGWRTPLGRRTPALRENQCPPHARTPVTRPQRLRLYETHSRPQ